MISDKPRQSKMWEKICQEHINSTNLHDISNFKSSDINFRLTIYNPKHNGVRYLKELIFFVASTLSDRQWQLLANIRNRDFGNPFSIRFNGENVCVDYLHAVLELSFLEREMNLQGARIVEIGAGYGRSCHSIISNYNLHSYTIIDLDNVLSLSSKYLAEVLPPEQFKKIQFLSIDKMGQAWQQTYDLCINIDSFAEMDEEVVRFYLNFIDRQGGAFFTKNPVGKYLNAQLDSHAAGDEAVRLALQTGLLRDIIDIHDMDQVRGQRDKFVTAYTPSPAWDCRADEHAGLWSYFWQAFYGKRPVGES